MSSASTSGGLVFVSHDSEDAELAGELVEGIGERGFARVFLSTQRERGIQGGERWETTLYEHLRRASAVVFLLTPASAESRWCFAELALARAFGKPILTASDPPGLTHPLTVSEQTIALRRDGGIPLSVDDVAGWLSQRIDPSDLPWPEGKCPYPGVESYTAEYEPVFYGRENEVRDILDAFAPLRRSPGLRRLVAVVGPSGCGKSSLVRAGVAPLLSRRPGWAVLQPFAPATDPLQGMAAAVADCIARTGEPANVDELMASLAAHDISSLERLARSDNPEGDQPQIVLVVDQFEELVTESIPSERSVFLELLDRLARGDLAVWVLITVRIEFVGGAEPNEVSEFLGAGALRHVLLPLTSDGASIRQVAARPAAKAGASIDDDLLDRIVDDVVSGDRSGASLPLLAFALRETWVRMEERRRSDVEPRTLTLADYAKTGGVDGVIAQQAKHATDQLALVGCQDEVLPTLSRFVVPTEVGDGVVRRRVPVGDLRGCAETVARAFESRRLLRVVDDHEPSFEVTHEAVFGEWKELRAYVQEHRQEIRDVAEAARRAQAWDRGGRDPGDVLRGSLLVRVAHVPNAREDPMLADYLEASIRADRESRIALVAERAQRAAEEALDQLPTQPLAAMTKAVREAVACRDEEIVPPLRLQEALYESLCRARETRREEAHSSAVAAVAATGGDLVASGGDDGRIRLWDRSGERPPLAAEGHRAGILGLTFSPDAAELASAGADGRILLWIVDGRADPRELDVHPDVPTAIAYDPRNRRLAAVTESGALLLWGLNDLRLIAEAAAHDSFATACAFHPDASRLYTAGSDGTIAVWDAAELRLLARAPAHTGPATCLATSRDGVRLASGGLDGCIRLWSDELAEVGPPLEGHRRLVTAVGFSREGRSVVSAGFDGTLRQFGLDGRASEAALIGHAETVCAMALAPDSGEVVSGGVDRTVRWWSARGRLLSDPIVGFPEPLNTVLFIPDGRLLASYDEKIWCFSDEGEQIGEPWEGHESFVWGLTLAPTGDLVASASADRTLRLWDLEGRQLAPPLTGHTGDVQNAAFTPDGSRLASASLDGSVRLWSREGASLHERLGGHGSQVNIVRVVPTGSQELVLSGAGDGTLCLWTLSGELRRSQSAHDGPVRYAALAGDGARLVSVGELGELRCWSLDLEPSGRPITAHDGPVSMVVGDPLGLAFTAGADGTVRRWTTALEPFGEPVLAHPGGTWALDADGTGARIATGGADGSIRIWRAGEWRTWLAEVEQRSAGLELATTD